MSDFLDGCELIRCANKECDAIGGKAYVEDNWTGVKHIKAILSETSDYRSATVDRGEFDFYCSEACLGPEIAAIQREGLRMLEEKNYTFDDKDDVTKQWVTLAEAQLFLHSTGVEVQDYIDKGILPHIWVEGQIYFYPEDIESLMTNLTGGEFFDL